MDGYRKKIKKKMKTFLEAVIDIPRRTYAKGVFDDADTNNPKIKDSVKAQIDKQIEEFEKEYPVVKIGLIGSILTKRYRDDADLDINVLFDVPVDKREDERLRLSQKYLSAKNPDNIQGKLIPGTKHPINFYFITDIQTYNDQEKKADAVFDIEDNKVDFPAFGNPTKPTSAKTLSSKFIHSSIPWVPGWLYCGACLVEVLKWTLPNPPIPPSNNTFSSLWFKISIEILSLSADFAIVPRGTSITTSFPFFPCFFEPCPPSPFSVG